MKRLTFCVRDDSFTVYEFWLSPARLPHMLRELRTETELTQFRYSSSKIILCSDTHELQRAGGALSSAAKITAEQTYFRLQELSSHGACIVQESSALCRILKTSSEPIWSWKPSGERYRVCDNMLQRLEPAAYFEESISFGDLLSVWPLSAEDGVMFVSQDGVILIAGFARATLELSWVFRTKLQSKELHVLAVEDI